MGDASLLFVGDVMLGRGVNAVLRHAAPEYPWGDTLPIFRQADFRMCNLECALSDRGTPWPDKAFHFRSDAKNVAVLKKAGIDAVSLANNHALDFGADALQDTLDVLDQAGIVHAGAGMDRDAAFEPAFVHAAGMRVALVSFTDNYEPGWEAAAARPGVAYVPVDFEEDRAAHLFDTIALARTKADIVVVAAHWGPNWGYEPPAPQPAFARRMVELGADVIFGHSAHVFRGVEVYRGRPIIYCAGDFIDDYAVDETERNDESFIFICDTGSSGIERVRLYPVLIDYARTRLATGKRAAAISYKMERLCREMTTIVISHEKDNYLQVPIAQAQC